jgi:catechol 2,3-dioxygenase-like lactoylglutathione lyase family enzyme
MHITGMVHININCSDYKKSKAFYEMLGFEEIWQVPETNTREVAAAVGMKPYRVTGALFALAGANPPLIIDLLEWKDPADDAPPYPHLYHIGLARMALMSSDLDADLKFLVERDVEIVGPIGTVATNKNHGSRFFCFKDPDGTYLELVENF